jgi:hypothetical protein
MKNILPNRIVETAKKLDANHEKLATRVEDISMATGVVACVAAAGAVFSAPTGLAAVDVWLGITSVPLIVTAEVVRKIFI